MLGEIVFFAGAFAPMRWAFCDGRRLPIADFDGLFGAIGRTFGGDDQTFAVPAIPDPVPRVRPIICIEGELLHDDRTPATDFMLGGIRLFAAPAVPRGWAACDGRSLPIDQFVALDSILDRRFGADAQRYRLPTLAGPGPGLHYEIAFAGTYPDFGGGTTRSQGLGEVRLWPGTRMPGGWAACDGAALAIRANTALFSVLGHAFGDDPGNTRYFLPHIAPAIPGVEFIICTSGVFPERE
jgi:microcystin-dependent protein